MKLEVMEFLILVGKGLLVACAIAMVVPLVLGFIEWVIVKFFKKDFQFFVAYAVLMFLSVPIGIFTGMDVIENTLLDKFKNEYEEDIQTYEEIVKEKSNVDDVEVSYGVGLNPFNLTTSLKVYITSDNDITTLEKSDYGQFSGIDDIVVVIDDVDTEDDDS